ncbi:fibronectin type III domain-containing protein [Diplocloster modestus]|uniref:M60 family metallopeptidase n=1 Tax=Diplocloster modestus TaxID=2850322 RepID=A0ABS6KDB7_9FIRM|nr:M60 family metallopeptidase [Diplocloster modestus]MBU9728509.1 M60 family metallopeptidase [Diplocloster modestus]
MRDLRKVIAWMLVLQCSLQLFAGTPVYASAATETPGKQTEAVQDGLNDAIPSETPAGAQSTQAPESTPAVTPDTGSPAATPEGVKPVGTPEGTAPDMTAAGVLPAAGPEEQKNGDAGKENAGINNTCELTVEIGFLLPEAKKELNVSIQPEQGEALVKALGPVAADGTVEKQAAVFGQLPTGKYSLKLWGTGYETYIQQLSLDTKGLSYRAAFLNSHELDETYRALEVHPGVIGYGDVNGDGKIDDSDKEELIAAMIGQEADSACDLNADQLVDLADLQYFTANYQAKPLEAVPYRSVLTSEMQVQVSEPNVMVNGELKDILDDNGSFVSMGRDGGEEITPEQPVQLEIETGSVVMEGFAIHPPVNSDNRIQEAEITLTLEDGSTLTCPVRSQAAYYRSRSLGPEAVMEADGTIVVNLGSQVAVKKITIKVTDTSSKKLADIAQVEFLNQMEDRIPAPQMNIPKNLTAEPGSREITVKWSRETNVTGYEVKVVSGEKSQVFSTAQNSLKITTLNNDKLENKVVYQISVQSVNDEWRSGYSESIEAVPVANKVPDPPENVSVGSLYRGLKISWKKMKDTDSYTLYYKKDKESQYQSVPGITTATYTLDDLENNAKYFIYLTGTNEVGTSKASAIYTGTTKNSQVKVTRYQLINRQKEGSSLTDHIENVTTDGYLPGKYPDGFDPAWVVDGDYDTYYYSNSNAQLAGATVTFDREYTMDHLILSAYQGEGFGSFAKWQVMVWDAQGTQTVYGSGDIGKGVTTAGVSGASNTIQVNFPKSDVKKIRVRYTRYYADPVTISELNFYEYSPLEDEINALWQDDLHMILKDSVTLVGLNDLRDRINTPDAVSGDLHPKKGLLLRELDNAMAVLNDTGLDVPLSIDTAVSSAYDSQTGFAGGLNSGQPLGVAARSGETLNVYVGSTGKKTGDNTNLRLVATQYHAEASAWSKTVAETLKVGMNEVTIPQISSLNMELGGSLYIEYKGNNAAEKYSVRVSGGTAIPVLDLSKTSESDRLEKITAYVEKLITYTDGLEQKHLQEHEKEDTNCNFAYRPQDCINNATEIVLDRVLLSVPATQVLAGLGKGTAAEQAQQLDRSMDAMERMTDLFYQHKGLGTYTQEQKNDPDFLAAYGNKNNLPVTRLNIRYMRMFSGAFMYAGGKHIGIEFGSVGGLSASPSLVSEENGKWSGGRFFGWGIAHEIGHEINQSQYAIAEITNNYFSVLSQAHDTNDSVRFQYKDVYEKVTSGTTGRAANVFTALGMYWQLHLAYDKDYNYKTYTDYAEQFQSLFFARVDAYARNTAIAPAPGGVKLTLEGKDVDNNLMRLSCAAAQKDLLSFFEHWGMVPNEATRAYAAQFEKETRPIWYINDEARVYTIEGNASTAGQASVQASLDHEGNSTQVKLNLSLQGADASSMLGYEISRNGKAIAFVTADQDQYTDTIATVNNRVFTYQVTAYDKWLNAAQPVTLAPVKISHDGSLDKTNWIAATNMSSEEDTAEVGSDENPEPGVISAVDQVIDRDYGNSYTGSVKSGNAVITLDFQELLTVAGFKYTAGTDGTPIKNYEIQVSTDNQNWETVKIGTFVLDENRTAVVYFNKEDDSWLYTYDASCLRLTAKNQKQVSVSEVDVLGPSGDNVELTDQGIGILKSDYVLDQSTGDKIPKGSLIFTGGYKGNPAYNALKLYNQKDELIEGVQVIFADVPAHGELGETENGYWVYYIEPDQLDSVMEEGLIKVRAELYRVDDANTNLGERLVSDTLWTQLPETIPEIELQGSGSRYQMQNQVK